MNNVPGTAVERIEVEMDADSQRKFERGSRASQSQGDRADEIAREIWPWDAYFDQSFNDERRAAIAAALRSYGDERLEAAANRICGYTGPEQPRFWAEVARSLKSQPIQDKP